MLHRLAVGALLAVVPFALAAGAVPNRVRRMPLEAEDEPNIVGRRGAAVAARAAPDPMRKPVPVTAEGAPALHRLVVGAVLTVAPLAGPQAPFTGVPFGSLVETHVSFCHTHQSLGPATSAMYICPPLSTSR